MFRTKKMLPLVCVALAAIARTVIVPLPVHADDTCTPATTFLGDYPDDDPDRTGQTIRKGWHMTKATGSSPPTTCSTHRTASIC